MNLQAITERTHHTYDTAVRVLGKLPEGLSVQDFIREATNVGNFDGYKVIPQKARKIFDGVTAALGELGGRAYLRAVIAQSVLNAAKSSHLKILPSLVAAHHARQLERISSDSDLQSEWLGIDLDLFHKEFGIATFRLYAAGSQVIDPKCGVPRSYMFKGGISEGPKRLITMLKLGGFRPYFQIHAHKFMLDLFSEQGREDCYRGCAELFVLYPQVRGMMGGSWFYDPVVARISPRLAYLQDTPLQNGAHVMFVEEGGDAISNALSTSPTRRKLYEEGGYVPKSYMLLWGKRALMQWAAMTTPAVSL